MKTHCHHAMEAALKKCGYTMDQVDNMMNKSPGWTWLVIQGKPNSPSLMPLFPDFYRIINEKSSVMAIELIRDIFQDPTIANGNQKDAYLDGIEDMTAFILQKMREREKENA